MELTQNQQRVIGCLLEKQVTTPEQYPLSLNALTNACNQKSNREPVLDLSEAEVQDTLEELMSLRLVTQDEGFSGRVNKYAHRFCNTEFGSLKFTEQEKALICVLLLRGPQTPGELRTRTNRLAEFHSVDEVESTLEKLVSQQHAVKHPRQPGKRESRYAHAFATQQAMDEGAQADEQDSASLALLQAEVADLKAQLAQIKAHLGL